MMLVLVGGFVAFRLFSKEEAPPRDFTALEFAGADASHTGSCYSLDTVLVANRSGSDATRTWSSPRDDVWTLKLDEIYQGNGGPVRVFQIYTFEKDGDQARLTSVEASEGQSTDVNRNIDLLIKDSKALRATPVDRCLEPGATGYLFKPRR
ncbi:MAG TPA: hypothetical protein VIV63_05165 [Steroidobacteraceae bacterium]